MHQAERCIRCLTWFAALLLSTLVTGCDAERHPIPGTGDLGLLAPTVTAVAPINNTADVPINTTIVTAAFSEPMAPITGGATFAVTCTAPCANATGTVELDVTNSVATFTLVSATSLAPLTLYTATVIGAKSLATGLALTSPYEWHFTTGVAPDTSTLTVGITGPATPAVAIKVLLVNGAQSKNVFWYVPAGATIGTGSTMAGTLLANAAITMSTTGGSPPTAVTTTVNGRVIALTAAVTMTNTVINVPAP